MDQAIRITTPFGARSTAAEVIAGVDLAGKRAIVTGASSGIGVETARALAHAGAAVTLAVRDTDAGARAAADIAAASPRRGREAAAGAEPRVAHLDLADRASIAAFVAAWEEPLDILVNNAGIMALPELELTAEGWELQFATNHLGHFALALGLHDALAAAGRRPHRRGQLHRASALAGRLRGHQLRRAALRAAAGLRSVQDRERALRRRRDGALVA